MHSLALDQTLDVEASAFAATMPAAYARLFDVADIAEHARLVAARGEASAHAAVWRKLRDELVLCVACDDRPGLLSLISDALAAHALDVTGAQIYLRKRPGPSLEMMGLFWVRRDPSSELSRVVDPEESRSVAHVLAELVAEQQRVDDQPGRRKHAASIAPQPIRVYFDTRALRSGESVLVVSAPDCPGMLLAITRSLYKKRAEIVASEVRTDEGVARDRFTICGAGGRRLEPDTLADVQQEVLSAVRRLVQRQTT
jgi:UTP:GlnB (protein PII) uridylyltransferase